METPLCDGSAKQGTTTPISQLPIAHPLPGGQVKDRVLNQDMAGLCWKQKLHGKPGAAEKPDVERNPEVLFTKPCVEQAVTVGHHSGVHVWAGLGDQQ